MRPVRTLGLCLIAAGVVAVVASTSAVAAARKCHYHEYVAKNGFVSCETEQEHAEFYGFAYCPFHEPPVSSEYDETQACVWGESSAKEEWPSKTTKERWEATEGRKAPEIPSEFRAGNVTVLLKNPITLLGGFEESYTGALQWIGARGAPTIEPVAQAAAPLTKDVDVAKLSASERNRYDYYTKIAKQTKVTATVELAGPATAIVLNENNLLEQTGTAFGFPVKVKLSNPFLGESCYVGSNEHPVVTEFSTGTSGELRGKAASQLVSNREGTILTVETDTLVSNDFAVPGVEGCGEGGAADEAVDAALELPSPAGKNIAVINGTLRQAGAPTAEEGLRGEV